MCNQVVLRDNVNAHWLWFKQPVEIIITRDPSHVLASLQRVDAAVTEEGLFAAGFISYEASPAFDPALSTHEPRGNLPLLWMGLYNKPEILDRLPAPGPATYTLGDWRPSVTESRFEQAIQQIKDHIARGDTYQVNYTFRLRTQFHGSSWHLFYNLQKAQQALYGAYIETDEYALCSVSPELFFHLDGERLCSRPMKGTASRGYNLEADERQIQWLQTSEKNRAENVMIVDMVRNDMGRVADFGTVKVPRLFEVERYPTVLQMTSAVEARTAASVTDVLETLFPSASITGAPKVRTMQIIEALEPSQRGIYTGAIGFIAPPSESKNRRAQFNVAIRTVHVDKRSGRAEYGVGSGIIWDSITASEYQECKMKAQILTIPPPTFSIIESMLWEPGLGYFLLERHLARLSDAAKYFVVSLNESAVLAELTDLAAALPPLPHKVRLLISQQGELSLETAPISSVKNERPLRVGLATDPVHPQDTFLYYKTTHRLAYEQALASRPDCDDVLLWNERGEITESTRANVVFRLSDASLVTPPLCSGLLAGTFRAELLAQDLIQEQIVRVEDLDAIEAIYLVNSVRRWLDTLWEPHTLITDIFHKMETPL